MKWRILIGLLLFCTIAYAQNIPVKGSLGVGAAPAPTNDYGAIHAVADISSGSTAESLEMKVGDVILEIDGIKIDSNQKIQSAIAAFVVGKKVTALVLRDGKEVKLKGTVKGNPPYKSPHHEIELLELPYKEGYVRAYLTHPKGEGPFPTIYFIHGYACQSVNDHPQSPNVQFMSAMVDMGYAVCRVEKPGVGEYANLDPCREYTFEEELENYTNGLQLLKGHKLIKQDQIYLFGYSLGGNTAPLMGTHPMVAGVMVFGTVVKPWPNYLVDLTLYSHTYSTDANEVAAKLPLLKSALHKLYDENLPHTELTDEEKQLLTDWQGYTPDGYTFTRSIDFWKSLNSYNFIKEWSKVKVPVLSIHGESDAHAISSLDMELIAHTINQKNAGQATFKLLENTNHGFAIVDTRAEELENINNGTATQIYFTRFNPALPELINSWIQSIQSEGGAKSPSTVYSIHSSNLKSDNKLSSMDVITDDFNGDGKKDIVVATEFGPNFILFHKDGKWSEKKTLPQLKEYTLPFRGEDSEDIASADFDKDGDLDLIFVSEDSENHELLYNDGNGQFSFAENQIPKTGQANAVLTYDFNDDGWQDILLGIRGQNELYINQKGKGFQLNENLLPKNEDHTQDFVMVDIDNDGDLDMIEGIEKGGNNLYINEKGTFMEKSDRLPLSEDIETRKIIANDFDQDGDMDLLFCNVGWNPGKDAQNQLLRNDGKGNFTNISDRLPTDNTTTLDAAFLDVNDDGHLDFITTNFINDKKVKVFLATPKEEKLFKESTDNLLPKINYTGGVSLMSFNEGKHQYLYFGNFQSKDFLLKSE